MTKEYIDDLTTPHLEWHWQFCKNKLTVCPDPAQWSVCHPRSVNTHDDYVAWERQLANELDRRAKHS